MNKDQLLARAFSLCDEIEQRQSQLRDILCLLMSAESSPQTQEQAAPQTTTFMPETVPVAEVPHIESMPNPIPDTTPVAPVEDAAESVEESVVEVTPTPEEIVAEVVTESTPLQKVQMHKVDLRKALTINDRFRFRRELFGGDEQAMNALLARLSECESVNKACDVVSSLGWDMDSEAVNEFIEFVRNNFNAHRS